MYGKLHTRTHSWFFVEIAKSYPNDCFPHKGKGTLIVFNIINMRNKQLMNMEE